MDYLKDLKADRDPASPLPGASPPGGGIVRDILPPSARQLRRARPERAATQGVASGRAQRAAGAGKRIRAPAPQAARGPETPPAETKDAAGIPVRRWEPDGTRRRRIRRAAIILGLGVLAALAFILPTFTFPTYIVTLRPALRSAAVDTAVSADIERINPDPGGKRIPALLVGASEQMSEEYDATGKKFVSEKAQGQVIIFNAYSSSPQTLVATTRLQAPSGAIYRLRDAVLVPGAKVEGGKIVPTSVAAAAVADEPGENANIGPVEFRIPGFRGSPKYQGFYARAAEGLSGGFAGEAQTVTEGDLTRASEDLTRRIVAKLRDELKAKSPPQDDFLVPDGAREVVIVSVENPKAGERRQRFSVTVSARARLMAVRRSHLTETLAALFAPPPPSGLALKFPAAQPELTVRDARFAADNTLAFTASGKLRYYLEPDVGEIERTLRASTPDKIEAYLKSRPEIESFRVKRFPAWLWFIPARTGGFRIAVEPPA